MSRKLFLILLVAMLVLPIAPASITAQSDTITIGFLPGTILGKKAQFVIPIPDGLTFFPQYFYPWEVRSAFFASRYQ